MMREIESLELVPLTKDNIIAVHEMCDRNVSGVKRSLEAFTRATLESDLFDKELTVVAIDAEGAIAAFFMAVLRHPFFMKKKRSVAVLKFFVVEKSWRNKGLATRIFKVLVEKLKAHEKKCSRMKIEVGTSLPDYWFPGLNPMNTEAFFFLKKHGFKKGGERINLCADLSLISDEAPPARLKGYYITRASKEEQEKVIPLKYIPKMYRLGFWPEEVALSFKNDPITTFIAKDRGGKIIGFATHSVHFPGSFGPTGVNGKVQGKGIGSLLLKWCLWDIKRQGIGTARIMWVMQDTAYFYLKSIGARICELFWVMKRRI